MAQNTGNLGMIIEHAHKKARLVRLTLLANFCKPSEVVQKKGLKEFVIKKIFHIRQCIKAQPLKHAYSNSSRSFNKFF